MANKKLFLLSSIFLLALLFLPLRPSEAASFNLPVTADTLKVGDKFSASIKIDTEGANINAAQVTLKFPANILEVSSFDKLNSIFNFWLQEPTFSNKDGSLSFTAGSTSGFSGSSLQVLTVNFTAIAAGTADLGFINGAITANDGNGTNVLSKLGGAKITVTSSITTPTTPSTPTTPGAPAIPAPPVVSVIPPPTQITRPAAPAAGLPAKPVLTIPLYPDSAKWYNLSSIFLVSWVLPADVSNIATSINKDPKSAPSASEGLFNNKTFPALDNGIWYLHVRFKNSVGWGPAAHYRLAIDTVPPIPVDVKLSEGLSSDNPTPTISFATGDQLSGIDNYYVKIDGQDKVSVKESPYALPVQKPGKHLLIVGAQDKAGNSTEDTVKFEILPIQSPTIMSATQKIFTGEGGLSISGQSLPNISVLLQIKDLGGNSIYLLKTEVDASGNWAARFDTPLKNGTYYIEATAEDARGALSLPIRSNSITVKERPVITILGLGITKTVLIILLLLILVGVFLVGWYFGRLISSQRQRKIIISQRDVSAAFNTLRADISKGIKMWSDKIIEDREVTELEFILKQTSENIDRLEKYILDGIKDIGATKINIRRKFKK